jgi:cytochrome c oxidase assembly protein subunit 11
VLLAKLAVVTGLMFGFGYLLVPFYYKLCEVAGLNQLQTADSVPRNTQVDAGRTITVQFDANLRDALPWVFRPLQATVQVHPGQFVQVVYEVRNESDRAVLAQAIPSYAPQAAAVYFRKLECFCFTQQTLRPHETRQMPVVFLIDSAIPGDMPTGRCRIRFRNRGRSARREQAEGTRCREHLIQTTQSKPVLLGSSAKESVGE